ncbi:schlafen family member 9-like [Rhinoderma darwinii]|uniref:schlafen family member 9-like n=1 Tax=Rhinoderma darwinii TaxID=43563 RepID=UPI003F674388
MTQRTPLGTISTNTGLPSVLLKDPDCHYLRQVFKYPDKLFYTDKATLGEGRRKNMNKEKRLCQGGNISKAVCALLNSGGGIVLIESDDEDFNYSTDGLGLDLECTLNKLIYDEDEDEYYDISQHGLYLFIFVKSWGVKKKGPMLCALDTGVYIRNFTSKKLANVRQVMDLIEKKSQGIGKRARFSTVPFGKCRVMERLLAKEFLCLGEKLDLGESKHVEFKDFSTESSPKRIKEVMKLYFSVFGNSDGGCLIIGVDDKRTVRGCGRETKGSDLEIFIREDLKSMRFAHLGDCEAENEFYTLTIKDVLDGNKHSGYVIFLEVKPFCCLGFVKDPQSWILDSKADNCLEEHLQAKQLTASEWVKILANQGPEPSLESQFERLAIDDRPPLAKPVYIKKGLEPLQELQDSLFGSIENGLIIKPDKLYEVLKAEHPGLEDKMNTILPNSGAVLLVSRSWAVDVDQKSSPNVVCDVLLLSPNNYPTLYSVFNSEVSEKEFDYTKRTAFALKQKLINVGSYAGKLCVIPAILCLDDKHEKLSFWPDIEYPVTYKLNNLVTVKALLQSLTIVILSFRNMLRDKIGIEYFNLLTIEQYKVLSKKLFNEIFFVHGPPGTGKTVIALEIIKRIKNMRNCSTDDILYICENKPLRDYVRSYNICQAMTRMRFVTQEHINVKHIVADEAQNFRQKEGNWFGKAKDIVWKSDGVFWVFLDYFQSYHNVLTGLPERKLQNKQILTKVVRSPQIIYTKILEEMKNIADKAKDPFLVELIERSGCCHGIQGFCEIKYLVHDDIVKYVSQNCERYLSKGYTQSDIAILCSTENHTSQYVGPLREEIRKLTKKRRITVKPFRRAEDISRDAIIVDTVRRFAGLESCIVFAINPVSEYQDVNENLFVCAASRATGNLHVLYEK